MFSAGRARKTSQPSTRPTRSRLGIVAVGLVAAIGLLLRLWAIGRAPVNADEAVVGLMAHEILRGHFFAFYWGQSYGGAEPYVVAAMFAIFGQSSFTLGMTPVLLDAIAAVLIWRIGRRVFSPSVGVAAALLFWTWPEVYIWQSTIEYGFRFAALDCGLGMMALALKVSDGPSRSRTNDRLSWAALGLLVGLGWWASPEIVYYLVPSGVLLVWRLAHRRVKVDPVAIASAAVTMLVGALPWLYDNIGKGFPSFRHGPQPNPPGNPFVEHLKIFVVHVAPTVLGLRLPVSGAWVVASVLAELLYAVAVVGGGLWVFHLVRQRSGLVLVFFVLLFPLVYAYSPFTWYYADGRYALYLAPVASLLAASAIDWLGARCLAGRLSVGGAQRLSAAVAVALGLGLTLGAVPRLDPFRPIAHGAPERTGWFSVAADPTGFDAQLATGLERDGIHDVYAGYWVSYVLAFEARGGIVASDLRYGRYQPYLTAIARSREPAWLFVDPTRLGAAAQLTGSSLLDPGCAVGGDRCLTASELESFLAAKKVTYRQLRVGDFVAVVPHAAIAPGVVFRAFRLPT